MTKEELFNSLIEKNKEDFSEDFTSALKDLFEERLQKRAEQIYRLIEDELEVKINNHRNKK